MPSKDRFHLLLWTDRRLIVNTPRPLKRNTVGSRFAKSLSVVRRFLPWNGRVPPRFVGLHEPENSREKAVTKLSTPSLACREQRPVQRLCLLSFAIIGPSKTVFTGDAT